MPGSENSISGFVYVYVLESLKTKGLYIGYTTDLEQKIKKHNGGDSFSTKPYIPWRLIFFECYLHRDDALRREKYLKANQGSRLLKRMLKEYFYNEKKNYEQEKKS